MTVVGNSLTWVDIDATAAYARGEDAARWLAAHTRHNGLVVWADASTTTVGPRPSAQPQAPLPVPEVSVSNR